MPGDLLVVNVSATIPAAVAGYKADGSAVRIHCSTRAPGLGPEWRVVELRSADGARPERARAGERISLPAGARVELVAPYVSGARLMLAVFSCVAGVEEYLSSHGEPIRYGYVHEQWPLEAYQNVYATTPGSAEMPSAGRPFTLGADRDADRPWRAHGPDHAAHRRLLARAPRGPVPGGVRSAGGDRAARKRGTRVGRPRDRGRDDRRARAGDGGPGRRYRSRPFPAGRAWSSGRNVDCRPSTVSSPAGTSRRPHTFRCSRRLPGQSCSRARTSRR